MRKWLQVVKGVSGDGKCLRQRKERLAMPEDSRGSEDMFLGWTS